MRSIDAEQLREALNWPSLIDALQTMFREGCSTPLRHHHTVQIPGEDDATLLLMPAWQSGRYLGVKGVTVYPGNSSRGIPAVHGTYLLSSGATGEPLALLDGSELTARRTAAASALAAGYLSRPDSEKLLMVGTGRLSLNLIAAHCSVRPIKQVTVWGRTPAKAEAIAEKATKIGVTAKATEDLAEACGEADVVSTATLSNEPLIKGEWLQAGTHLDLVGGFTPQMREADDECIRRARVFVDTRDGALQEAGDVVVPLQTGVLQEKDVAGDLFDLCRDVVPGRETSKEITLFKSVGTALEDLAAAILVYESTRYRPV